MSDTPMKLIVDVAKGTHEYVALTPAEIAERDQAAAQAAVEQAAKEPCGMWYEPDKKVDLIRQIVQGKFDNDAINF